MITTIPNHSVVVVPIPWDGWLWIGVFAVERGCRISLTSVWYVCPGCAGIHKA